mgnify:CR=1 FL=1
MTEFGTVTVEVFDVMGGSKTATFPRENSLKELQNLVGGFIEMVRPHNAGGHLQDDEIFIVNEEGLLHNLDTNPTYPFFVGPVVKMKDADFD